MPLLITVWACAYLFCGWLSARLFIHELTDGLWEPDVSGHRAPMGIGTGFAWLLLWPLLWIVVTIVAVVAVLTDPDTWRWVFGIK